MKRHRNFEINSPNNYEKSMENELGAEWLTVIYIIKFDTSSTGYLLTIINSRVSVCH